MNVSSSTSLNPAMSAMLAQLTPSGAAASQPVPSSNTSSASAAAGVGTGSGRASVSDAILDLFSKMHQASGSAHHGGGASGSGSASGSTTTLSTASTMISPLDQLMAALGIDEDESAESADTSSDLSMFYPQNNGSNS